MSANEEKTINCKRPDIVPPALTDEDWEPETDVAEWMHKLLDSEVVRS